MITTIPLLHLRKAASLKKIHTKTLEDCPVPWYPVLILHSLSGIETSSFNLTNILKFRATTDAPLCGCILICALLLGNCPSVLLHTQLWGGDRG